MKINVVLLVVSLTVAYSAVIKEENKQTLMPKNVLSYIKLSEIPRKEKNKIEKQKSEEKKEVDEMAKPVVEAEEDKVQEEVKSEEVKPKKDAKLKHARFHKGKEFKFPVSDYSENKRIKKSTTKEYCVQTRCGSAVCGPLLSVKGPGASNIDEADDNHLVQPIVTSVPVWYEFEDVWPYSRTIGASQFASYQPNIQTLGQIYQPQQNLNLPGLLSHQQLALPALQNLVQLQSQLQSLPAYQNLVQLQSQLPNYQNLLLQNIPVHSNLLQLQNIPTYQNLLQLQTQLQNQPSIGEPVSLTCLPGLGGTYSCHRYATSLLRMNDTFRELDELTSPNEYLDEHMKLAEAQRLKVIENEMRAAAVRQIAPGRGLLGPSPYYSQGYYQQGGYMPPYFRSNDVSASSDTNDDCLSKMINIAMKLGLFPTPGTSARSDDEEEMEELTVEDEDEDEKDEDLNSKSVRQIQDEEQEPEDVPEPKEPEDEPEPVKPETKKTVEAIDPNDYKVFSKISDKHMMENLRKYFNRR